MDYFVFKKGELYCEDIPVREIAEKVGTPLYIYSSATLKRHFNAFARPLANCRHLVCFAVKANSSIAILHLLGRLGAGADIVSGGELFRALRAGIPANRIVYSGVGKTRKEVAYALKSDILMFNVESMDELDTIKDVAMAMGKKARISFRVNPDVDPKTHPYISTGLKKNKFGLSVQKAIEAYRLASRMDGLEVTGISCHIGSQITETGPFKEAAEKIKDIVQLLEKDGIGLKFIDMGGGLGVRYRDESPPGPEEYLSAILPVLSSLPQTLILEPGRAICANAGILISRLLYTKDSDKKRFYIIDAGMNDLARPSLYQAYHEITPVKKHNAEMPAQFKLADIVGPICETGDFLAKDRPMPLIKNGELIAVKSVGAYGFSMSSNYNSRPRAAEVLVTGDRFEIIRERETHEDLIRGEKFGEKFKEENCSPQYHMTRTPIAFKKMHGSGNDFILIDNRTSLINGEKASELARCLCRRKFSAGADGLILIEHSEIADFKWRFFNADGSEAEMCGNGGRCAARFAVIAGIAGPKLSFETKTGLIHAEVNGTMVKLELPPPSGMELDILLNMEGRDIVAHFINTGVPHTIVFEDDLERCDVTGIGRIIRFHEYFKPAGTNVNFIKVVGRDVLIRTYERGVEGETLACGTGAVAGAIIASVKAGLSSPVWMKTRGGEILKVYFDLSDGVAKQVFLEGEAVLVYSGMLDGDIC
ncbi:MAG: diaminopimelate decarboxylase [Dissulfurimicrobium sp.]|uniref:diaminopimelate decarboxylase n=1 Tax=Dissulfurimicrobium sp. TaxID=2022436 RepID=UPI00404A1CCF